jgi:hypothetical protein
MSDKVGKVSVLLQSLSRLPGLGFLAQADRQFRDAAEQVDEVGETYEEGQRQLEDVRRAAGDVTRPDDDD